MCFPDVLALQEINENRVRGFQISQIKRELNYYLHFGSNMELHGDNMVLLLLQNFL